MDNMNRFGKPSAEPANEASASTAVPVRPSGRVIDIDDLLIGRRFHHFEVRARLGRNAAGTNWPEAALLADFAASARPSITIRGGK